MIFPFIFIGGSACQSTPSSKPPKIQTTRIFSPDLIDIVEKLEWYYHSDCLGVYAKWYTTLPSGTSVQMLTGPKIEGGHFDEAALQNVTSQVDMQGQVELIAPSSKAYDVKQTFVNLRVWAHNDEILALLQASQNKGGFPVAPGPNGAYGWAEALIPPCTP